MAEMSIKRGKKSQRAGRAGDRDDAVLQRLPQPLQCTRAKLGQFIQKQHAVVGQADLAGAWPVAAADQPGVADRVVRAAKGRGHGRGGAG